MVMRFTALEEKNSQENTFNIDHLIENNKILNKTFFFIMGI